MPRMIRYHLDENCDPAIAVGLRRRSVDVTTTPEADLLEAVDEVQLAHAHSQERVIFTQDQDFLRLHARGIPHSGIVYCKQNKLALGEIIAGLVLIWEVYEPEELGNRLEFL